MSLFDLLDLIQRQDPVVNNRRNADIDIGHHSVGLIVYNSCGDLGEAYFCSALSVLFDRFCTDISNEMQSTAESGKERRRGASHAIDSDGVVVAPGRMDLWPQLIYAP